MKGFLEEYGLIIVVVAVILLMLLFGKTGYAKSIQDAILGSTNHIVETGENITKGLDVKASDILNIEGTKYIVLESNGDNALVMTADNIGKSTKRKFQANYDNNTYLRTDGQKANTYEGSDIDKYLENTWYKGLSTKMQNAIQVSNIKQASYARHQDTDSKQETGYNGQVYNTISRHVYLPSVSEIGKVVNLKNRDKVKAFLEITRINVSIWTRDSYQGEAYEVELLESYSGGYMCANYVDFDYYVRPAFVIDLSKVDYTEAGHVDYK